MSEEEKDREIARLRKDRDDADKAAAGWKRLQEETDIDRNNLKAWMEAVKPLIKELAEWGCMKEECDWVAACPQSKIPVEEWCISCRAEAILEDETNGGSLHAH